MVRDRVRTREARTLWLRVRAQWNWSDTTVFASNSVAFLFFIGNCWWESLPAAYAGLAIALGFQTARASRVNDALRDALSFGALAGATWPLGEWLVVRVLGWWGRYVAVGPCVLDTPVYTVLIGALAGAYCYYVGQRAVDLGYGRAASSVVSGISALGIGALGEALFVGARMWEYAPTPMALGTVPLFVPVAYGIGYACLPLVKPFSLVPRALVFNAMLLAISTGLGIVTGFFPRP